MQTTNVNMYAQKKEWKNVSLVLISRLWRYESFSSFYFLQMSMCDFVMKKNSAMGRMRGPPHPPL